MVTLFELICSKVSFLNQLVSILYEDGLTCGAVYPLLRVILDLFNFYWYLQIYILCERCFKIDPTQRRSSYKIISRLPDIIDKLSTNTRSFQS